MNTKLQSTKTRAEVYAELKEAQAQGDYVIGGHEFTAPDANFVSTKTRARLARNGEAANLN